MIRECYDCKHFKLYYDEEPCISCVDFRNFSPVVDSNTEKEIRSKAIKEFAERLREWSYRTEFCTPVVDVEDIDRLEKEMVGESNG